MRNFLPLYIRSVALSSYEHSVNQAVCARLVSGHIVISIRVALNGRNISARVLRQNAVELGFGAEDMFRLDFDIARLTLCTAEGLVNHNFAVGQSETLALCAAR